MIAWKEGKPYRRQMDSCGDPERTHRREDSYFTKAARRNVVQDKIWPDTAIVKVGTSIAYIVNAFGLSIADGPPQRQR